MAVSLPSTAILLIDPTPGLCEILRRNFPTAPTETCSSFKETVRYIPRHLYQAVICPQRIASFNDYSLLSLNQLHNPNAPFIITTERAEDPDVRQAIDKGALGFLHESTTAPQIICIIKRLLSLYRLRCSLERRVKWATNFSDRLQRAPVQKKSNVLSDTREDNRVMCEQSVIAIEGSMQAFQAEANQLVSEARQRMWDT